MMAGTPAVSWQIHAGHDEVIQATFRSPYHAKSQTMPTTPPRPTLEPPSKRPWHRLHLSTWMLILLLVGFWVIVELPGEAEYDFLASGSSPSGGGGIVFGERFLHGWPWPYLERYEGILLGEEVDIPWLTSRAWNVFSHPESRIFSFLYAMLDFVICLAIIAAVALGFEWRRRRHTRLFQFTLCELLLLMLLAAGVFSWWKMHHNQRIREQAIVNRFQADIYWTEECRMPQILLKIFGKALFSDFGIYTEYECGFYDDQQKHVEGFSSLREFFNLEKICCDCTREEESFVTDELLLRIADLKNIQFLDISGAKITDSGMETIARFTKLNHLKLTHTAITSRGVQCLKSMPLLETLYLDETKIDDAAAETLATFENLRELDVSGTKLTDKSVPHLGRLSRLEHLDISGTEISEEGFRKLKVRLPDCDIRWK